MPYIEIPTYQNGQWSVTSFNSKEEYRDFILPLFKQPGKYGFNETTKIFNQEGEKFKQQKYYCNAPLKSRDYVQYWDDQKLKCRKGLIVKDENNTWYLTREYYMWLNFLPIYNKETKKFEFANVRDVQYHIALYELLAELHDRHIIICKKRQLGSTYFHIGKIINVFWFEEGAVLKIGASLDTYINQNGAWKFLDEYRTHLNEHTAWYRPTNPGKVGSWKQVVQVRINGRDVTKGLKSTINSYTFDKDPSSGVGGPCHRLGTLILMSNGKYKKIEDICVGENVLGIDNHPKKVLRLFRGESEIYEVKQSRGISYYVTGEHLLYLKNRDSNVKEKNKTRLVKTSDWNNLSKNQKITYVGERINHPLKFYNNFEEPTLDPYFLGLWLGDGYREKVGFIINKTKDVEILEYIIQLGEKLNEKLNIKRKEEKRYNDEMYSISYSISNNGIDGYTTKQFVKYNLFYNKHIPDEFLYGSIKTRLELLAGIIDTDGYYNPEKSHFEITAKSKKFINQIKFLCRSLGGTIRESVTCSKEHVVKGALIKYSETNRLSVYFQDNSIIPTKIKRKQGIKIRNKNINTSVIKFVIKKEIEPYAGIEVEDNLYLLEDNTITHNCSIFYYEESGMSKTLDQTYGFIRPALESGDIITGQFIAAGSVGDLEQSEPLQRYLRKPEANGFYGIETNLLDDKGTISVTGLFIPEQWGMPPYIDKYGNSLVEKALIALEEKFEKAKKEMEGEAYQLMISQHPRNIEEAFASKKTSVFPLHLVSKQIQRIQDKKYPVEYLELERTEKEIVAKNSRKTPISEFPISKTTVDKEGVICVYERPVSSPSFGMYYASVDPVGVGITKTSDSLCSIYVYKNPVVVTKDDGNKTETFIEREKIVCSWCGRFDDIKKTHERLEMIIEWYNARTIVENNVGLFILYMMEKKKQRYLVPKSEMLFLKEIDGNKSNVSEDYGWRNVGTLFKGTILSYGIEFLKEELEHETKPDGTIVHTTYGVERIPDIMLLKEMQAYRDGLNVDRLIAYCFLPNQWVGMDHGFKFIENVNVDEKVITHTNQFKKVKATSKKQYQGEIINLDIAGILENIKCTPEHLFYVAKDRGPNNQKICGENWKYKGTLPIKDWVKAKDIQKDDYFLIPKRKNLEDNCLSWFELYLLGWFLSDGYLSDVNQCTIVFQLNQLHIAEFIKSEIEKIDEFLPTYYEIKNQYGAISKHCGIKKKPVITKIKNINAYSLRFTSDVVTNLIRTYTVYNKKNKEKYINKNLYFTKNLLPLVLGFFEGDGHQKNNKLNGKNRYVLECCGANLNLILQIRQIMLDNDVWNTINISDTNTKGKWNGKRLYRIDVQDYKSINKIVEKSLKFYKINETIKQKNNYILKDEGFWAKIKKVTKEEYNGFVYNLEVEDDESYTINNIVTHNCSLIAFVKVQEANRPIMSRNTSQIKIKEDKKLYQIKSSPFRHIGEISKKRNPFKNIK
jgi:intein/homing endonuclease